MKNLFAVFVLFTLAGCATAPTVAPSAALFRAQSISDKSTAAQVDTVFYRTLADCQVVLTGLETKSENLKWWGVGLQTAGGLLGSVFLPIAVVRGAAQSVTVALGALAGFTNTEISVVRNEGLGAADVIRQRALIQANIQAGMMEYFPARDAEPMDRGKAAVAIGKIRAACMLYWIASPTLVSVPIE